MNTQPPKISCDQLHGESAKAFAAFRKFLSMGEQRSVRKLARKCHKGATTIKNWSVKYHWQERLKVWLADMAEKEQAAMEEEMKHRAKVWSDREMAHREKRFQLGQKMIKKAEELLNGRRRFEPAQAYKLAAAGDKLVGLATGLSTDNTSISTPDGAPIITAPAGTVHVYLPEKKKLPDEAAPVVPIAAPAAAPK